MRSTKSAPLDSEEVLKEDHEALRNPYSSLIELLPISLIALAVLFRYLDIHWWPYFLITGGGLAAISYLFLSWYMFKVQRYVLFEVILSVLFGGVFAIGVTGIVFKIQSWEDADQLIRLAVYAGSSMTICAFILFIFHFRDDRASIFYRSLLSRLLVVTAILLRVYVEF